MGGINNIVFIVFATLGALLVAVPLPKALASGNLGTTMLIVWTELATLVQLVNAIRWHRNVKNWAPLWCDFCGCFLLVADLALVASAVSINRRLYMIITLDPKRQEKAINVAVDIVLCLVIPCASVALQYVVQQYRFFIYEDIGCLAGIGNVNLAFPLVWMLPVFVGIVSAVYACLTFRAYFRRNRRQTGESGMNSAWSRRLMAIGVVSTLYGLVPTSIAIILLATSNPVIPWPGWKAVHSTIGLIVHIPAQEWRSNSTRIASMELRRWTIVTLDFMVFVLLGLTEDVKRMYRAPFRSVIEQTLSFVQTGTVLQPAGDSSDQNSPRSSRSYRNYFVPVSKQRAERREENFGLNNRPRSDLEGFQLVFPVSQAHTDATPPAYPSWKLHREREGYPNYI